MINVPGTAQQPRPLASCYDRAFHAGTFLMGRGFWLVSTTYSIGLSAISRIGSAFTCSREVEAPNPGESNGQPHVTFNAYLRVRREIETERVQAQALLAQRSLWNAIPTELFASSRRTRSS